jgi:hypothetical protein
MYVHVLSIVACPFVIFLLDIVLSVLLQFDLRIMITPLDSGAPEGYVDVVTHDFEVPSSQLLVTH